MRYRNLPKVTTKTDIKYTDTETDTDKCRGDGVHAADLFSHLLPTSNAPVPTRPITPLQSIAVPSDEVFTASRELPASRTTAINTRTQRQMQNPSEWRLGALLDWPPGVFFS